MSFWYGLGFEDLAMMPMATMQAYVERIPARMAELKLAMAEAVSLPHMKEGDRKSTLARLERLAGMDELSAQPRVAPRGALLLMGIGVRRGPLPDLPPQVGEGE